MRSNPSLESGCRIERRAIARIIGFDNRQIGLLSGAYIVYLRLQVAQMNPADNTNFAFRIQHR
jgi:hypothetical protein